MNRYPSRLGDSLALALVFVALALLVWLVSRI
jgi:hypothetical protein